MPAGAPKGSNRGGGRKPGQKNRALHWKAKAAALQMEVAAGKKRAPIQVILEVMEGANKRTITDRMFKAAIEAAPYVHPKLSAVAVKQVPNPEDERRRAALSGLSYQQRREILAIIGPAMGGEIEGVVEGEVGDER